MYNLQLLTTLPKSRHTLTILINKINLDKEDIKLLLVIDNIVTVELSLLGQLLTLQISSKHKIVKEIHVKAPVEKLI